MNALGRDEVHRSVWCLLDVPHLASLFPDFAGGGLSRDRVVSRQRVLFSFYGRNLLSVYSYV